MAEHIHLTHPETVLHILKQLVQITFFKSALNNDETPMNKRLEFGFPVEEIAISKSDWKLFELSYSAWIQKILITTIQKSRKVTQKAKIYLNIEKEKKLPKYRMRNISGIH